jgi:predicted CopG family antitoxin
MGSRTVSLEDSAYERLKAAKRPGESFSVTITRILEGSRPTYRSLAGFLSRSEGQELHRAVKRMRAAEAPAELERLEQMRRGHGHHSGH